MPVISALISAATTFVAGLTWASVGAAVGRFALQMVATFAVSSLLSRRSNTGAGSNSSVNQGSRIQLPPSTDNKIPVVYGDAFMKPIIIDAKISTDQKTMWYVLAFSEAMDSDSVGTVNITNIYWGDKLCVFEDSDKSKVTKWVNADGTDDTSPNGLINIYGYRDGSSVPVAAQPSIPSAITVMSDAAIDAGKRWTSTNKMIKLVFAIVKMTYNNDKGITGLPEITAKISNSVNTPGLVIKDYLTNTRYGAGLPLSMVDTTKLTALDTYAAETISYTPHGGGSKVNMRRYTINGPADTSRTFLENLTDMCESCDSWLQWNEQTGQWGVVINKGYASTSSIIQINDNQIVGGISINPLDLNSSFNKVEVQFPNSNIRDQNSYYSVKLEEFGLSKFPNEPDNTLSLSLPLTNNLVQAQFVAARRMLQSRDDLVISFQMNYSGIQIDAGDIIGIHHDYYGWGKDPVTGAWYDTSQTMPYGKLFRINQVQEDRSGEGNLYTRITASEYNNNVYVDDSLLLADFQLSLNSGIPDPNNMVKPAAPTFTNVVNNAAVPTFTVNSVVPSTGGSVKAVEYWYGTSPNLAVGEIQLYSVDAPAGAVFFTAGGSSLMDVPGLKAATYYWRVRTVGARRKSDWSDASSLSWSPTFQSAIVGSGFQVNFQPSQQPIPRTYVGGILTPTLTGIVPKAYGTVAGLTIPFVKATSDTDPLFTTNSWRIAATSSTGIVNGSSVVQTGITFDPTAITTNTDLGAWFPSPTGVSANPSQLEILIRYKDAAGNIVQSNPARSIFAYMTDGAAGATGISGATGAVGASGAGVTLSRPHIYFLAPINIGKSAITITGGVFNRVTQTFSTRPTVAYTGNSNATNSDSAMSITTGSYRWGAFADANVSQASTGTFNVTWTDATQPYIDAGFGPTGNDGVSGKSIDFILTNGSAFVLNSSNVATPTSIKVQVTGTNVSGLASPNWDTVTGTASQTKTTTSVGGDTWTVTPDPNASSVYFRVEYDGFVKTISLPILKSGIPGATGPSGATGALGATGLQGATGASTASRGFVPLAFIPVVSDPTSVLSAQLTTWWTSYFGVAPIANDGASFYYGTGSTSKTRSASYNGSSWVNAAQAIPGDLIVDGTIRSNAFAANTIYAYKFASTGNTGGNFGNNSVSGFWLDATNGNARFGGDVSIGNNLTVQGLITTGALNTNTVGTGQISANGVSRVFVSNYEGTYTTPTATNNPTYWTNNTRTSPLTAINIGIPSDTIYYSGGFLTITFSGQIYAVNQEPISLEIWRFKSVGSVWTRLNHVGGWNDGQDGYASGALHPITGYPPRAQRLLAETVQTVFAWDQPNSTMGTVQYFGVIALVNGLSGQQLEMNAPWLQVTEFKR